MLSEKNVLQKKLVQNEISKKSKTTFFFSWFNMPSQPTYYYHHYVERVFQCTVSHMSIHQQK